MLPSRPGARPASAGYPMSRHPGQLWQSLPEALRAVGRVEQVELKAIVEGDLEGLSAVLGNEAGRPRSRRVHYLDTPDLALHKRGIIVRARITDIPCEENAHRKEDVIVRLRRPAAEAPLRSSEVTLELDALPVHTAWAASMKRRLDPGEVERALVRRRPVRDLLTKRQHHLLRRLTRSEIDTDELAVFGPVEVVRLVSGPPGDRLGIESWVLPDGSQIVELFAKCLPGRSRAMVNHIRDLIGDFGISLAEHQFTKTQVSLRRLARARG